MPVRLAASVAQEVAFPPTWATQFGGPFSFPKKLQNVMAVTDALSRFWHKRRLLTRQEVAMEKELMLLALRFALFAAPVAVMYLVG